jgi:hypothetical protein
VAKTNKSRHSADKTDEQRALDNHGDNKEAPFTNPDRDQRHDNEIHGPGKGAHTSEPEVRPQHMPADKPRRP